VSGDEEDDSEQSSEDSEDNDSESSTGESENEESDAVVSVEAKVVASEKKPAASVKRTNPDRAVKVKRVDAVEDVPVAESSVLSFPADDISFGLYGDGDVGYESVRFFY
jgi:hypothetical protein